MNQAHESKWMLHAARGVSQASFIQMWSRQSQRAELKPQPTKDDHDDAFASWSGWMAELKSRENYQHREVLRGERWNNYDLWTGTSLKNNPQDHM